MEAIESSDMHSEDNKDFPEKSKKRRFKTPFQVEALEKFYTEHKYPSEEMKSQIAESIGLTEKQVSGWFCHRRLKDKKSWSGEAAANGRQDRSSVIVHDHASGHRQDSCGSTKQGDNRDFDPREVESRRFRGQDFSAADLAYEHGNHHRGNSSDTSSGSSLPLQCGFHNQNEDPFDVATSRHLPHNENIMPINVMGIRTRIGPSGYLKLKGKVENAAITAVKRQLGRHYREDGPPLGIEFDPIPPGTFESSIRDPVNEPYNLGDPDPCHSPDFLRICKQPNSGTRYEVYNSKMSLHNSGLDGTSFKTMHGSDHHQREDCLGHQPIQNPHLPTKPFPGRISSIEMEEGSAGEMSIYDSGRLSKIKSKHDGERKIKPLVSSHHPRPTGHQATGIETKPWLCNAYNVTPEDAHREHFNSKNINKTLKPSKSLDMEDGQLSRRMDKEDKFYGEWRSFNEHCNSASAMIHPTIEMRAANRDRNEFPQQLCASKASMEETPLRTNQIKRSMVESPSSCSEDEIAETSSSKD